MTSLWASRLEDGSWLLLNSLLLKLVETVIFRLVDLLYAIFIGIIVVFLAV